MSVGSLLSCDRGPVMAILFLATGTSHLMYVVVWAYLVRNIKPVGNRVTANAFVGIDFNNGAGFI